MILIKPGDKILVHAKGTDNRLVTWDLTKLWLDKITKTLGENQGRLGSTKRSYTVFTAGIIGTNRSIEISEKEYYRLLNLQIAKD